MTLKYILLNTESCNAIYNYFKRVREMLLDSGFGPEITQHAYFTPHVHTFDEFKVQFDKAQKQCIDEYHAMSSKKTSSTISVPDPLLHLKQLKNIPWLGNPLEWQEMLERLNEVMEWSLVWYAKQDPHILPNSRDQCSPHIRHVFGPVVDQVLERMASDEHESKEVDLELERRKRRDILVVMCREPKVTHKTFRLFHLYCSTYGIHDAVLLTQQTTQSFIVKKAQTQCTDEMKEDPLTGIRPTNTYVRVIPYMGKPGLFYNIIRNHWDIPLFRLLNPLEVKIYEQRYGSVSKFAKLKESEPVCRYYGFKVGQVILCIRSPKQIGPDQKYKTILEQIDQTETWIDDLEARIVV